MNLSAIRHRLASLEGRAYWRSLEEARRHAEFQDYLHREFSEPRRAVHRPGRPAPVPEADGRVPGAGRRQRLHSSRPRRSCPTSRQPEEIMPGRPLFFATAMPLGGVAHPILAESHMGRPTKLEGNPDHPASGGTTSHLTQASILDLYDPDRLQAPRFRGALQPWSAFLVAAQSAMAAQQARRRGASPVDRDGHLAVARRADPGAARGSARGAVAPVRSGEPRPGAGRGAAGVRPRARRALPLRPGRRGPVARRRLPRRGPRHVRHARDFSARRRVRGRPEDA